jgi:pimeloyl-ACP methyl ester carboxylesterase
MKSFRLDVDHAMLDDLDRRLTSTRYAHASSSEPWANGMPPAVLRRLVEYWHDHFDWPAVVARLNTVSQFTADLDGRSLHWADYAGRPGAPTIVVTHGWPYTFAELLPLAERLAGDFRVIVPSLPGYIFSEQRDEPFTGPAVAELWHRLLSEVLQTPAYFTYGEDVGAGISDWLAASHPEAVLGIIASHAAFPPASRQSDPTPDELVFEAWRAEQRVTGSGYATMQRTKPDTLAAALTDSPAGLAAWIVEKFHAWSEQDGTESDIGPFTFDQLLTTVMLYWTTGSIGSSFRPYLDAGLDPDIPLIDVPAAVIVQTHERLYPESYAHRTYTDLRSFERLARGGHFAADEAPDALAATIRRFVAEVLA